MLYKIRFWVYIMRYVIATVTAPKIAIPSTFFLANTKSIPTTANTKSINATAERNKKRLQYFLPKGPKREFIIHSPQKRFL